MNLTKLFEMQRELDRRIVKEKGLEGKDLLPQKILALQVELGECANEWRGFKFWSKDQQPRTLKIHSDRDAYLETNPLLEEYIDCLHFILSIGIEIRYEIEDARYLHKHNIQVYKTLSGVTEQFNDTFTAITEMNQYGFEDHESYEELFLCFLALGEILGYTWEQIEEAYMAKNAVNHDRQSTGY